MPRQAPRPEAWWSVVEVERNGEDLTVFRYTIGDDFGFCVEAYTGSGEESDEEIRERYAQS